MLDLANSEQFADVEKREHALRFGMWTFLASELMLFAGLFALYAAYRTRFPVEFAAAAGHNAILIGTANTYILITSSFTVALTIWAVRAERFKLVTTLLLVTMAFGFLFLILKSIEYTKHIHEGFMPGAWYSSAELTSHGARMFWTLYWVTTGLHALHVIAGLCVLGWLTLRSRHRAYTADNYVFLEMGTLYWHLVDIVWIFLWPLLYLTH